MNAKLLNIVCIVLSCISLVVAIRAKCQSNRIMNVISQEMFMNAHNILAIQKEMLIKKGIHIEGAVVRIGDYAEKW